MIDVALAHSLRDAGLRWHPATGDRFLIESAAFQAEDGEPDIFTISEMTIEAHDYPTGTELGFNGTTEWALDSVSTDDSLWLPREDQLRELLGPTFRSLTKGTEPEPSYRILVTVDREEHEFTDADAENAYGQALLAYIDASLHIGEFDD